MSNLKKRHREDLRFKLYGMGAILLAFAFLAFLLFDIVQKGVNGFQQTQIRLEIYFDPEIIDSGSLTKLVRNSLDRRFPDVTDISDKRQLYRLVPDAAKFILQDEIEANRGLIGHTVLFWLPAHEKVNIYLKKNTSDWESKISSKQKDFVAALQKTGDIDINFNSRFFDYGDSQEPELAGIGGAMAGSLLTILVCMLTALPLAIFAAVYLEEFAPKNRFTDFLEININNLAAVPSIVYGLLGLAIYLNFFGMPRSAALVGGLTLALMVVPVIVIATRAALKAVPSSIRLAAMGIGASPLQVVLHHSLPLAAPGIMTGIILSIARALGETAPLLMIGMVAFIADIPTSFTEPASVLPVQIFLWSKNNQIGFVEKTAAAILILLIILIVLNLIAVWVRKKYERRW